MRNTTSHTVCIWYFSSQDNRLWTCLYSVQCQLICPYFSLYLIISTGEDDIEGEEDEEEELGGEENEDEDEDEEEEEEDDES